MLKIFVCVFLLKLKLNLAFFFDILKQRKKPNSERCHYEQKEKFIPFNRTARKLQKHKNLNQSYDI